jgi:hypothetical protein
MSMAIFADKFLFVFMNAQDKDFYRNAQDKYFCNIC